MLEWLIPIVVDNAIGYFLDQSGLGEQIRSKFEHKPVKDAFQRSLQKTFTHFEKLYPQLAAEDLFEQSFQNPICASIFAQLLLRDSQPNSDALARLWANTLFKGDTKRIAAAFNQFQPIAEDFLNYLDKALRTEALFREIHDSQAFEHAAQGINVLANDFHNYVNQFVPLTLTDSEIQEQCIQYCKKLYEQWKTLDFKGIQHTDVNRPVAIPLIDVFVLPDVLIGVPAFETLERDEILSAALEKKNKLADKNRSTICYRSFIPTREVQEKNQFSNKEKIYARSWPSIDD